MTRDHDEGRTFLAVHRDQAILQIGEHRRVDAAGRLVEQHQPRSAHEGHRGVEQFLLAVGQAAGGLRCKMVELEEADHLVGYLCQAGIGRTKQPAEHAALVLLAGQDQVFSH
jgi:hypothetical protein